MENDQICLRRDQYDPDSFFLEVLAAFVGPIISCHLNVGSIYDLFGEEAYRSAKSFEPGEYRIVKLEMKFLQKKRRTNVKSFPICLRHDHYDPNAFFLEILTLRDSAVACYLFVDAINDLFGNEICQKARSLASGERRIVELEMKILNPTQEENQE